MKKDTLSPETIERVCRLNTRLLEAANWIEERARRTREAYFTGGGRENFEQRGECWENYELEAFVKCSPGNDDPAFSPDDEYTNIIAAQTLFLLPDKGEGEPWKWNDCSYGWGEGLHHYCVFDQTGFCCLFHEIFDHTLHNDLDAFLRIGEIEINLVLLRQRGVSVDPALLPRKRKKSYPRSVYGQTPCGGKYLPLTYRELRYARLLNQTLDEGRAWIEEQLRRCKQEYKAIGGLDRRRAADGAYEDYELMLHVQGFLGENHPEYGEDENNLVVTHSEALGHESQHVFGRPRNPCRYDRYGAYFAKRRVRCVIDRYDDLWKVRPCGLFWDLFREAHHDWLKMLSIGDLWFETASVQRRIAVV